MGLDLEMSISKWIPYPNGYDDLKRLSYILFAALNSFLWRITWSILGK